MTGSAIIVGGGIAGATAASLLARAGHSVLLLERERVVRPKVCGEFLSHAAQAYLQRLGLDAQSLGARRVTVLRVGRGRECIAAPLPFEGLSLSRQVLDAALLQHAVAAGARVERGHAVRGIETQDGPALLMDDGRILRPDTLFLASGKHDIRGAARPMPSGADLIGVKMHFDLADRPAAMLDGNIALFLFAGGYAGLTRLSENRANLSLLIERSRFAAFDHDWRAMLAGLACENALLDQYLSGATALCDRPATIYRQPFGYLAAKPRDGIFRLGDQLACVPSFSGDGMSVAFHSAFCAADTYLRGGNAVHYHATVRRDLAAQLLWARGIGALIRTSVGQGLLMHLMDRVPSLLTLAARRTRLDTIRPLYGALPSSMRMSGTSLLSS